MLEDVSPVFPTENVFVTRSTLKFTSKLMCNANVTKQFDKLWSLISL